LTISLLYLRQITTQYIVHGKGPNRTFDNTGCWVINQISRNAEGFGQQLVDAPQERTAAA
jgi:hypothetical protein